MRKKPLVSLVEDNEDLRECWQEMLQCEGIECNAYENAAAALKADHSDVDVLVTDFYLPDMDGVALIYHVRNKLPNLPVILLTGSREINIVQSMRKIENSYLLHKPTNIEQVEQITWRIFREKGKDLKQPEL